MTDGQFYNDGFSPKLIVSQIVFLQSAFYFSLVTIATFLVHNITGEASWARVFSHSSYVLSSIYGQILLASVLLNAILMAFVTARAVERSKKCADFVSTTYFLHALISWCTYGFPASSGWWISNISGFVCGTLLAEFICMRTELQDIRIDRPAEPPGPDAV
eukprot:GDKH01002643.1.p1 GENE.GDKH01002643.1~~GDKH01002643.1.p1  ORF type:complete len:161 (-),score=16.60 GDKH01002643.1:172-654(-)